MRPSEEHSRAHVRAQVQEVQAPAELQLSCVQMRAVQARKSLTALRALSGRAEFPTPPPACTWCNVVAEARMTTQPAPTVEQCRQFYAQEIRWLANLTTPALIDALAQVPREKFLGAPPWQIGSAE